MKMSEKGTCVRINDLSLQDAGGGSFKSDVVESANCQITYIVQNEGAGHDFHQHEDLDEILILLEGHGVLGLGDSTHDIQGGSLIHAPRGVPHKVKYLTKSKVIRIKFPSPRP